MNWNKKKNKKKEPVCLGNNLNKTDQNKNICINHLILHFHPCKKTSLYLYVHIHVEKEIKMEIFITMLIWHERREMKDKWKEKKRNEWITKHTLLFSTPSTPLERAWWDDSLNTLEEYICFLGFQHH